MRIEVDGRTRIACPIQDVFDYVSDPRNEPKWLPGATAVEMTSEGPVGLGSTFVGHYSRAGRVELTLVEFERPRKVTFRAHSKIVDFDDAVELSENDTGTRLEARMLATPRGLMRLFGPVMARTLRRQFAANWDHLRHTMETSSGGQPP
jgi:carbon monoxide dehydrogenase subunit G